MQEVFKKPGVGTALLALLICGAALLGVKTLAELRAFPQIGKTPAMQNSISVTGKSEQYVTPNIAEVTFDVMEESSTVAKAQDVVNKKMADIIAYLKSENIDEKDIKTVNYSVYPRNDYVQSAKVCYADGACTYPVGKQVLVGYDVTNSVQIKIRNTENAGKILTQLGTLKATNVSGLNFVVENEDKIRDDARGEAIKDAKAKADLLAKQLGVKIVGVINFNDQVYYPMYEAKNQSLGMGAAIATDAAVPAPIQAGQNKITSQVTITYEIR